MEKTYYSFNEVSEKESTWASCLTQEFLQDLNFGGFPPHELKLKVGAQVMVLRNLNSKAGKHVRFLQPLSDNEFKFAYNMVSPAHANCMRTH